MKLKTITLTILAVLIVGAAAYALYLTGGNGVIESSVSQATEQLLISPQDARTSVTINRATLAQGGYLVVRGSDGKRIGQVVEISEYLSAGAHENITIELGEFYTYKEGDQLIVMIYYDDGDTSFNELDQPASTASAVFVKTGSLVPLSVLEQQVAASNGMGMETVRYTNTGFQPAKLTVPVGTMVEFVNQSGGEMWVASNVHPSHEKLPTLDQFKGVGKGQTYMYIFDKKGTWPYHDHINPAFEGSIVVE